MTAQEYLEIEYKKTKEEIRVIRSFRGFRVKKRRVNEI